MNAYKTELRNEDELGRLCALDRMHVLDTEPEPEFEKITKLVQTIFEVPVAAVSLIDRRRQWFKSIQGLDTKETVREVAFCDYTIRSTDCLQVTDAQLDPRFCHNELVTGSPYIRSYLGAPIITRDGYALGALCAIDFRPRSFTPEQRRVLTTFASLVMNEFELRQVASVDSLTGLATRRAFVEKVKEVAGTCEPASLIFLDMDRFKTINDTYGHPAGDAVLKAVARAIMESSNASAFFGRLGGEELAVLLPVTDNAAGIDAAERIRSAIEHARTERFPALAFTASLGVSFKTSRLDHETWMAKADAALYAAKNSGRNCVRHASMTAT